MEYAYLWTGSEQGGKEQCAEFLKAVDLLIFPFHIQKPVCIKHRMRQISAPIPSSPVRTAKQLKGHRPKYVFSLLNPVPIYHRSHDPGISDCVEHFLEERGDPLFSARATLTSVSALPKRGFCTDTLRMRVLQGKGMHSIYLVIATRAACGPSFPCSSMNVTSVPNFNRPKSSLSTLFR